MRSLVPESFRGGCSFGAGIDQNDLLDLNRTLPQASIGGSQRLV